MKRLSHILIALLCPLYIFSQLAETIIVGEIYDHLSGEPLPNVNVVLQGTSYGTISSPEGLFLLRCNIDKPRQMIVSAIGYHTQRFRIEPGMQVGIDIEMQEKVNSLNEVFVVPGANPALPLMEQVRKHRQYNSQLLVQTTDSNNTGATFGAVLKISPIVISFVIVAIFSPPFLSRSISFPLRKI